MVLSSEKVARRRAGVADNKIGRRARAKAAALLCLSAGTKKWFDDATVGCGNDARMLLALKNLEILSFNVGRDVAEMIWHRG